MYPLFYTNLFIVTFTKLWSLLLLICRDMNSFKYAVEWKFVLIEQFCYPLAYFVFIMWYAQLHMSVQYIGRNLVYVLFMFIYLW